MTLRRREYLKESTFNIDRDVNLIYYDSGFDRIARSVGSKDKDKILYSFKYFRTGNPILTTDSSYFKTKDAVEAHKVNPVAIRVGVFRSGSYYDPFKKAISISSNYSGYKFMKENNCDYEKIKEYSGEYIADQLFNEFSEKTMKGTIHHELAHWIDDSLHNQHIAKSLGKANEITAKGKKNPWGKYTSVVHSPIEMNAQIHVIKFLKDEIGDDAYNKLTWNDLFRMKTSLKKNFKGFRDKDDYEKIIKEFLRRLEREGLLTKEMRKYPSYRDMQLMVWE